MPAVLSSLIDVPREGLSAVLAREAPSRPRLREWLARVPDPRGPRGRWHPLEFVLALAVNDAVHGYLAAVPQAGQDELPEAARREREQRRAAAQARRLPVAGLLPQAAADGKAVRGATRPDGTRVHLLSAFHVGEGRTLAQREVGAKANEIPGLEPLLEGLDLEGTVVTLDALHAQREATRLITEGHGGHYIMFVKANQPTLLAQVTAALAGTDREFSATTRAEEGKGHGRRERRSIRTAPADGIDWPGSAQVMRIRRDTGPTRGHWTAKEVACAITSLPPGLASPRHLATRARLHWSVENREYYARGDQRILALYGYA